MANDELKTLHSAIIDAQRGYDEAAADAETPCLSGLFGGMAELHERHHAEVRRALVQAGEPIVEGGSFMSSVNKGVVAARAAITGLQGALPAFASGEERVIARNDAAITAASSPAIADMLRRQQGDLQAKGATMKAQAAS